MSFWIQHGYGKGTKVVDLLGQQFASGVLLSPGDEPRSTLVATAGESIALGAEVLLDPQLYVHTIPNGQARCHESNGVDFGSISWSVSPRTLQSHIDAVLDLVGNSTMLDSLNMVRRDGKVCLAGWLGGLAPIADFNPLLQMPSGVDLTFFGSFVFGTPGFPLSEVPLQAIAADVEAGDDRVHISATFLY